MEALWECGAIDQEFEENHPKPENVARASKSAIETLGCVER
jgi:hypothetical protein